MIKKTINHMVEATYDLKDHLDGYTVVDTSLGPKGEICVLAVNEVPERIDGMFPPIQTAEEHTYQVLIFSEKETKKIVLENQTWNYHMVQPINQQDIIVVCARSYLNEDGSFDRNAKVFDYDGKLVREFLLGDGIQEMSVTEGNTIWTSYFDEGIYGNYGWENPIGSNGLRAWDSFGNPLYEYPSKSPYFIDDCYALNIQGEEDAWFYFSSEFMLGRYHNGSLEFYKPDVEGADGFLIYEDFVLFRGGYDKQDRYILYRLLPGNKLSRKGFVTFVDEDSQLVKSDQVSCRGSFLLGRQGNIMFLVDLKNIADAF